MVDGPVGERSVGPPLPRRVFQRQKQRPLNVVAVAGGFEVVVEALEGQRVGRHVPDLATLSQDAQVGHALAALKGEHKELWYAQDTSPMSSTGRKDRCRARNAPSS